ncbi:hypothetical protein JCM3765_001192 [Sporobolomyces pararoseus]
MTPSSATPSTSQASRTTMGHCVIWFMHKKTCGNRSNPFVFPGFVESEIEEILKTSIEATSASAGSAEPGWLEYIQMKDGVVSGASLQQRLRDKLEKWKEPIDTSLPQSELIELRTLAYRVRGNLVLSNKTARFEDILTRVSEHPIDHLAHSLTSLDIPELTTQNPNFRSQFLHLHLVYITSTLACLKAASNRTQTVDTEYPSLRIRQFVLENLGSIQPELSRRIIKRYENVRQKALDKTLELEEEGKGLEELLASRIRLEEYR